MTPNYAPTVNPGDVRRRVNQINLLTPLGGAISAVVFEEDVIRLADGSEAPFRGQGVISTIINPTDAAQLSAVFPLRAYSDDALLGSEMNVGTVLTAFFSWVRAQQLARDNAHIAVVPPEPPVEEPPAEEPIP